MSAFPSRSCTLVESSCDIKPWYSPTTATPRLGKQYTRNLYLQANKTSPNHMMRTRTAYYFPVICRVSWKLDIHVNVELYGIGQISYYNVFESIPCRPFHYKWCFSVRLIVLSIAIRDEQKNDLSIVSGPRSK